jgi:hypothetical protein
MVLNQVDRDSKGRKVFRCVGVSDATRLTKINHNYASMLGNVFHATDRTNNPIKHEIKTAFPWLCTELI